MPNPRKLHLSPSSAAKLSERLAARGIMYTPADIETWTMGAALAARLWLDLRSHMPFGEFMGDELDSGPELEKGA